MAPGTDLAYMEHGGFLRFRAQQVADRILPAYNTTTKIPLNIINLATQQAKNPTWNQRCVQAGRVWESIRTRSDFVAEATDAWLRGGQVDLPHLWRAYNVCNGCAGSLHVQGIHAGRVWDAPG